MFTFALFLFLRSTVQFAPVDLYFTSNQSKTARYLQQLLFIKGKNQYVQNVKTIILNTIELSKAYLQVY